jgi:methylthioxylose transferase
LLGLLLSLLVCYCVATQSLVLGSPTGGWVYPYVRKLSVRPLGAALIVAGACGVLLLVESWRRGRFEATVVLAWTLGATVLQGLLRSLTPVSLEAIFVSNGANEFYGVTERYGARTVLENYQQVQAHFPTHLKTNMPGKTMLLYALEAITTRTDVLPWLLLLLANVGGVLMYLFVRDLFGNRQIALYSLVLYLFVPAKLFFLPLMDTVTPTLVLACACLLLTWLRTGKTVYAALLGAAVYGLAFFEPLPLIMGVLFAAVIARAVLGGDVVGSRLALQVAAGVVTFAATFAAMRLWFGFDLLDTFQTISANSVEFYTVAERPYSIWIPENLREFAFGAGICQVVMFWPALIDGFKGPGGWRVHLFKPIVLLCLGLLGVLIVLDLLGVTRGEVIRLWIFLACFLQIPTAYVCARLQNSAAIVLVVAATTLQAALGTAMIGFVVVA